MNYLMNDLQAGVLLGVAGSGPATNCGVTLRQRYAEQITPEGGDVRDTVRQIQKLNDMDTPTLYAGQRLVVPVDE